MFYVPGVPVITPHVGSQYTTLPWDRAANLDRQLEADNTSGYRMSALNAEECTRREERGTFTMYIHSNVSGVRDGRFEEPGPERGAHLALFLHIRAGCD